LPAQSRVPLPAGSAKGHRAVLGRICGSVSPSATRLRRAADEYDRGNHLL